MSDRRDIPALAGCIHFHGHGAASGQGAFQGPRRIRAQIAPAVFFGSVDNTRVSVDRQCDRQRLTSNRLGKSTAFKLRCRRRRRYALGIGACLANISARPNRDDFSCIPSIIRIRQKMVGAIQTHKALWMVLPQQKSLSRFQYQQSDQRDCEE